MSTMCARSACARSVPSRPSSPPNGCSRRRRWLPTAFDLDNIVSFGVQVLEEDAAVCEINQRGLHSQRHEAGVLMPEEYDIHRFHRWVREQHERIANSE